MNAYRTGAPVNNIRGRFPKEHQLDDSLEIVNNQICRKAKGGRSLTTGPLPSLPGHPMKSLENTSDNNRTLEAFVSKEFTTRKLNTMAPHLWLVATQNHASISPLHEQLVRGRRIVITEDPEMHLLWIDDKVFVKPIPPYLLSHAFWEKYLDSSLTSPFQREMSEAVLPAILGYLRSWTYLVGYESDFIIAKQSHLIPHGVQFARFLRFLSNFTEQNVQNAEVSPRYRYGQLRLSRLNMWAKLFLKQRYFEEVYWQYWQYFQTFYAPLLFIFGVFTVVLGAMQVGLTAPDIWPAFMAVSVWFSVLTLLVVALTAVVLVLLFISKGLTEAVFAIRAMMK